MSYVEGRRPRFDLGRVVERTFGAIGANAATLLIAAGLFVLLPQVAFGYIQTQLFAGNVDFGMGFFVNSLIAFIVSLICGTLMQGVATHAAVSDLQGRKTSFGQSMGVALRHLLPLIGLSILAGLAVGLGMILLIVPGVILALMWAVVAPVVIIEGKGVFEAFGRSRDLTRSHRLMTLVLFAVYILLTWAFWAFVGVLTGGALAMTTDDAFFWQTVLVGPLVTALLTIVSAAGIAALYVELRTVKEGSGSGREAIAAVFD